MKFEQVCQTMHTYLSQKPMSSALLPLAAPLMLVFSALRILDNFISMDAVILAITFFGFFFCLVLTLSACSFLMTTAGLGLYTLDYIISLLRSLLVGHYFSLSTLLYVLVFGFFTYQSLRKYSAM